MDCRLDGPILRTGGTTLLHFQPRCAYAMIFPWHVLIEDWRLPVYTRDGTGQNYKPLGRRPVAIY